MQASPLPLAVAFLVLLTPFPAPAQSATWWTADLQKVVDQAGDNEKEIVAALTHVPEAQRPGMAFLVRHMPKRDLRSLNARFLLDNVALAYEVKKRVSWGSSIPQDIFFNDVLPYANTSETREAWRKDFRGRFLPLVEKCKTPGEAAQVLNEKIFGILEVKYSTRRRRADQSPSESIEIGMASCTGLSILLTDACRAVGVPARLAGIRSWVNKRGNHTWVEVWDDGWHFTGAAEPNEKGLDHTWFQRDAALAKRDTRRHAIWAVSYKKTADTFPMVWSRDSEPAYAVNVTDRYTKNDAKSRLMIRVRAWPGGPRVAADVRILDAAATGDKPLHTGRSKDEGSDTNDILGFDVARNRTYRIAVREGGLSRVVERRFGAGNQKIVDVTLMTRNELAFAKETSAWFKAPVDKRPGFSAATDEFVRANEARARELAWHSFVGSRIHDDLRKDFAAKRVRWRTHESPYTVKTLGGKPVNGWPLFIAMHGGGGAPQRVNDRQWRVMRRYYRDQKGVKGYLYLALRAPNNKWNGFYDHYVWHLVTKLIRQFVVCGDVDPDKVFLMGYSHGGYGAFAIGPNIPDRFAAIHSSAAAPTPGISPARNLRNTVFTFMIGARDTRYGRAERCRGFATEIAKLRGDHTDIYPVTMEWKKGHGHGGLPDKDKIKTMYPHVRTPAPRELSWKLTGETVDSFYWLSVPAPKGDVAIEASCKDNQITLKLENTRCVVLGLDSRLVDFGKPIILTVNGKKRDVEVPRPGAAALCRSMSERGDPRLASTAQVVVNLK